MAGITELGYVRFGVSDLAEWQTFATDILALEVVAEDEPDTLYLRSDSWHHRIILEQTGEDDLVGAGLRVAGAEEFLEMQQRLQTAGVAFELGTLELAQKRRVLDIMTLVDPANNPIEIFHGPQVDAHKPFHPSRGMFGKFVTGDGGVGHMILRTQGLDQSYEFYKLLGMRGGVEYKFPTPDGGAAEVMFMHCNSRDHSVAFGPPSKKSINHLMIEVDNIDDVFLTHEKVQASKYPVMISLGKHANDHMFSFYFATPSKWLIELGTSGRPATHQSEYFTRDMYGHEFNKDIGATMSIDSQ
jgi:2,3-dihydroxybiphenyl 1,2-dioxygenase